MHNQNPAAQVASGPNDDELVDLALTGDVAALRQLLERHQVWIFNLALYMLHRRSDAEDATQEILVKAVTGLSGFRKSSQFRTWVRRIAVNHVLDFRRSRPEQVVTGFGCYSEYLEHAVDSEAFSAPAASPEQQLMVEEARISCTMGMLLCLDREQRLAFLLGEILETSDTLAAELVGISRDNFRKRLSRAREQLSSFMQGRCGLVNPENPCRCARKTAAFIKDGIVDPNSIQFARGHLQHLAVIADEYRQQLGEVAQKSRELTRRFYPLFEAPDVVRELAPLLDGPQIQVERAPN